MAALYDIYRLSISSMEYSYLGGRGNHIFCMEKSSIKDNLVALSEEED